MTSNQIVSIVSNGLTRFDKVHKTIYLEEILRLLTLDMRVIGIDETNDLTERLRYYELKDAVEEIERILAGQSIKKKKLDGQDDSARDMFDENR